MGKAAKRQKAKRTRHFQRLAKSNPARFEFEWEKTLSGWLFWINKNAGKLRDDDGNPVKPVFSIVNNALEILEACGKRTYRKYAEKTYDVLSTQCHISFSNCLPKFYRDSKDKRMRERQTYNIKSQW